MGRYLILWETNQSLMPESPADRAKIYLDMIRAVKEGLKKGLKDWGTCVGNNLGYAIFEGDEISLGLNVEQYRPYITFKTYPIANVEDAEKLSRALIKMQR